MTSATFVTVPLADSAPAARQDLPDQALLTTESVRRKRAGPVTLSIIAPLFNAQQTLPRFHRRLADAMEHIGEPFELVLVDDGSTDATGVIMRDLHGQDLRVRGITFSRNFGHQAAISAGLQAARGQAAVIIDSDL
jgi:glycosyltransferase involved in cell wall biosynthesis